MYKNENIKYIYVYVRRVCSMCSKAVCFLFIIKYYSKFFFASGTAAAAAPD